MRLERVIAKDSRRATEQVIEQFGADALIISNQKVNGMTEIVVAVDIDAEPMEAHPGERTFARDEQAEADALTRGPDRSETSAARAEPVFTSLPKMPASVEPGLETWSAGHFGQALRQSMTTTQAPAVAAAESTGSRSAAPVRPQPAHEVPRWLSKVASTPMGPAPERGHEAPTAPSDEAVRARELVDMVREELASMRREIALSRQMSSHAAGRQLDPEVQPIIHALEQANVPVALRALLTEQVADCSDAAQAYSVIRTCLIDSIQVAPQRDAFTGVHVIAGPSGSGKTQMACRIATRHAATRGAGSVALISFADQRIGAWTQLQMLAARTGIECYKVADGPLLGALLGELSSRELIVIDTSAAAWKNGLSAIAECAPEARFNLVLPADASLPTVQRFQSEGWAWNGLMLSKLDESMQPWPVIQALCNQAFSLSIGGSDPVIEALPRTIDPSELVDLALSQCMPHRPPSTTPSARPRKTSTKKSAKELRNAA